MCSKQLTAIEVNHVTKKYNRYGKPLQRLKAILFGNKPHYANPFIALNDVSLVINKGQTVGIIGENGSGKSTLLQIICGLLTADAGHVKVNGRIAALLELGAGFNPEFSGKENVMINAALLGLTADEIAARYDDMVNFAEINEFINQPVKTYSSGMYVRLAFAVAIHVQPDILIIDEALAVGDARFQAKCFKKIEAIKKAGATILFVSHDVSSIRQFCDQAIWLEKGCVKMAGDVLMVTSKYMEHLFSSEMNDSTTTIALEPTNHDHLSDKTKNMPTLNNLSTTSHRYNEQATVPINHWGSHQGSILSCQLLHASGRPGCVFNDDEQINLQLRFQMPDTVDYASFGVAFVMRALNGTDLIVYDSFGQGIRFVPDKQHYDVLFTLINPLNAGHYMLVAVLEDRRSKVPAYYEFIEGIAFFSVMRSKTHFGLFVPPVSIAINAY